jgi:hypothetical protein
MSKGKKEQRGDQGASIAGPVGYQPGPSAREQAEGAIVYDGKTEEVIAKTEFSNDKPPPMSQEHGMSARFIIDHAGQDKGSALVVTATADGDRIGLQEFARRYFGSAFPVVSEEDHPTEGCYTLTLHPEPLYVADGRSPGCAQRTARALHHLCKAKVPDAMKHAVRDIVAAIVYHCGTESNEAERVALLASALELGDHAQKEVARDLRCAAEALS